MTLTRRSLLRRSAGAAALFAAPLGAPFVARASEASKVSLGGMSNGWSLMATTLMKERGFDRKHKVEVETKFYPTLSIYYADYVAGRIDVAMGAWDFFATQYLKGTPIKLLGAVSTYSMAGFLVGPKGPRTVEELKGKSVAALQGGGLYSLTKATLKKFSNIELEKDSPVQNIQNINAGVTLVAADRADATLVWEPGLATGLQKIQGSRILITIDDYLKKHVGREGPYFALSLQQETLKRDPSVARRLEDVYHELFAYVAKHPDEFAEMGKVQDLDPAIMREALNSGRLKLALRPAREDKHRSDMQFFADLLSESGGLPGKLDGGFYIA
ncbi:MAG: ABC transporter substrate-binding protein [Reyranellaceae bacterium]